MLRLLTAGCATFAALVLLAAPALAARTCKIAPIDLGSGYTLSGSMSATGIGPLTDAKIVI